MKKILLFGLSWLFSNLILAQDTARLKVQIQNENLTPLSGEQIIFEAQSGSYTIKGISDEKGLFTVPLLGDQTYDIKLKTVGESQEYNTFTIPALEPNTKYGENMLTITIFPPKSFTLNNVLFETGKSVLKSASKQELDELYEYLSLKPNLKIEISGHTDNVGDDEANQLLSENRSKAVKDYLVAKGIESDRLTTSGYGSSRPVASNDSTEGRQLNRRTEVLVLSE